MELQELKDKMSKDLFGLTKSEANKKGVCVQCKLPAFERCHTEAGKREYYISGMCEICWAKMFEGEE